MIGNSAKIKINMKIKVINLTPEVRKLAVKAK